MHTMFQIFGRQIPAYGLLIVTGVLCANVIAYVLIRRAKLDHNDLIILEGYGFLGGFTGAKLLYLLVSAKDIDWSRITDTEVLSQLLRGGFVFYGGILGALPAVFLAGKLHRIDARRILREIVFLIPFVHAFGRVGCFLAGCCYGCPYEGVLAVHYPPGGIAPSGTGLFPVQLLEAALLFVLSLTGLMLQQMQKMPHPVRTYLIVYGGMRFLLEFLRADAARGSLFAFSTSQYISMAVVCGAVLYSLRNAQTLRPGQKHLV